MKKKKTPGELMADAFDHSDADTYEFALPVGNVFEDVSILVHGMGTPEKAKKKMREFVMFLVEGKLPVK